MLLTDLIVSTAILDDCGSLEKSEVVQRLLMRLADDGRLNRDSVPSILEAVMRRESLGSTGIGQGIAVPHAKHPTVRQTFSILAICRPPVNSDSIDGELTDIFVLLLAPRDVPGVELRQTSRGSERLLRVLMNAEFRGRLRESMSEKAIWDVLAAVQSSDFY